MRKLQTISLFIVTLCLLVSCATPGAEFEKPVQELYDKGVAALQAGEYEDARKFFQAVKARDAKKTLYPHALIGVADAYYDERRYEEAAVEYQAFLKLHQYHARAPYAQYRLALSHLNQVEGVDRGFGNVREARKEFVRLLDRYPRNEYREIAEIKIKQCDDLLAEYEYYVGKFYLRKESYAAAVRRFEGILSTYPKAAILPKALAGLGVGYRKLGKDDKAREVLARLVNEFPMSSQAAEAAKILKPEE
jgi:outer membrane protein assembly factor BamD